MHSKTVIEGIEPIAIVGIAFKFPQGATSEEKFWQLLLEKRCASSKFPDDRLNIEAFHSADPKKINKIATTKGHFLEDDIRNFDTQFFGLHPAEAASMDSQHRMLLETTYHALESAGLDLKTVAGSRTSVHVGCFTTDVASIHWRDSQRMPKYSATGGSTCILSNRISWFYDLKGPSMTIDTACSSSLIALDLACKGLWRGDAETAIVGGANLIQTPDLSIALSNMSFLSPDGRCFSFDHRANGYARGEGVAVLVLKPLSRALQDNDTIRALIRSVSSNQDGHTKGGLTQPSAEMQAQLIAETYQKAGISMAETRFFEAHGTGTLIGDPIEAEAIGQSFFPYLSPQNPLYVGALKSNLGHLEGVSGLAAVIKAILAVEHGIIPPNANFERPNPRIDDELFNLVVSYFPTVATPWPETSRGVRRASVNNFGFGGTNVHVVLDDVRSYIHQRASDLDGTHDRTALSHNVVVNGAHIIGTHVNGDQNGNLPKYTSPKLLLFSASDADGCLRMARTLSTSSLVHDNMKREEFLDDLVYTFNVRRTEFPWRSFCLIEVLEDLCTLEARSSKPLRIQQRQSGILFVFTGQGAQWTGMGRELFDWPIFANSISSTQKHLDQLGCTWSVRDILTHGNGAEVLDDPQYSQVLSTAIQIGLIEILRHLRIKPAVVVGHSSGEIAAAYCAGLIDHISAVKISYYRGVLASSLACDSRHPHSMLAIGLSPKEFQQYLNESESISRADADEISISCINSPSSITVSGPRGSLDVLAKILEQDGIFARQLKVSLGYHSPQMNQISSEYRHLMGQLSPGSLEPGIRMISSVTGGYLQCHDTTSAAYWSRNMTSVVDFAGALRKCLGITSQAPLEKAINQSHLDSVLIDGILEIGPTSALKGPIRQLLQQVLRIEEVFYTSALVRGKPAHETFLEAYGNLYSQAVPVDKERLTRLTRRSTLRPTLLTGLPSYPFEHGTIHWEESRANKEYRFRRYPYNRFLGVPLPDWTPSQKRWRLILHEEEQPWIKEHLVNGVNVYPATGMLVMAIEAARQLMAGNPPKEYVFEAVEFSSPILLDDSASGVEVQIDLSLVHTDKERSQYQFRICTWKREEIWEENCHGTVSGEYGRIVSEVDHGQEDALLDSEIGRLHDEAASFCSDDLHADFYSAIETEIGIGYGPTFQRLKNICSNELGHATAFLNPIEEDCIVHPATLDAVLHLLFAALHGRSDSFRTMVPSKVHQLRLDASGIGHTGADEEMVRLVASKPTRKTARSSISILRYPSRKVALRNTDFEFAAVSANAGHSTSLEDSKNICNYIRWKPDTDMLGRYPIQEYCAPSGAHMKDPAHFFVDLEIVALAFSCRALAATEQTPLCNSTLSCHVAWLRLVLDSAIATMPPAMKGLYEECMTKDHVLNMLCDKVAAQKAGKLYVEVGRNLVDMLAGKVDPLVVLFGDESLMKDFYDEMIATSRAQKSLETYVDMLVHKRPDLRFLEIGAGTGGSTHNMLTVLEDMAGHRFSKYVFSDISPSFLENARKRFGSRPKMEYRPLDIEIDPADQGFGDYEYDVIVADMVLHATSDLSKTLGHIRKLLKPGGKLIMKETTTPKRMLSGFVFGLLPGWWLSVEDSRIVQKSPCITEAEWDMLLKSTGFSGADVVFQDFQDEQCHVWSILISHVPVAAQSGKEEEAGVPRPAFVVDREDCYQTEVAEKVMANLGLSLATEDVMTLEQTATCPGLAQQDLIVLLEITTPFLSRITPANFSSLQRALYQCKSVVWVTRDEAHNPEYGVGCGLARVLRYENPGTAMVTLALGGLSPSKESTVTSVSAAFRVTQEALKNGQDYEPEYAAKEGILHINRLVQQHALNEHIFYRTSNPVVPEKLDTGSVKMGIRALGLLDTIQFSHDDRVYDDLGPDEVIVEVKSIGINFKDLLILLGRVDVGALTSECAGVVSRAGSACGNITPGTRVVVFAIDDYRSHLRTTVDRVTMIPDWLSFQDAASLLVAFCTAHYSLVHVARLQQNETVLIHAAAGGTGQAAVQVAQHVGAKVFATVGSLEKKKLLMDVYGIAESHIFYSRDSSFELGVMRMTGNRGVDVILNSSSGKLLHATWRSIAPFGRFVEIGRADVDMGKSLPMHPFSKNATFTSVELSYVLEHGPSRRRGLFEQILELICAGKYRPVHPVQVYDVSKIEEAFRFLQRGKSTGKIVINLDSESVIPTVQRRESAYELSPGASYLISGSSGGLGREIARWLCKRGAKNLILLSRSGMKDHKARELVESLIQTGVSVECPACDVSDKASLRNALSVCAHLPPIKGCFQAAMVLCDSTFNNMTFEEWQQGIAPKVQASWNLHELLSGLDFFIMLSSAGGIFGNGGQGNYAAGNTFQDALAQYRVSRGEKAVSLDLGLIKEEGFVAENEKVKERLARLNILQPIALQELHAIFDYYCNPALDLLPTDQCQLVTGLQANKDDAPAAYSQPLFRCLHQTRRPEVPGTRNEEADENFLVLFKNGSDTAEAAAVVVEMLRAKISRMLVMPIDEIEASSQLAHYGVDSLVALELRNWLLKELGADLAVFEILGGVTLVDIAKVVAQRSTLR